jgi:hypothetical protein
MTLDFRLRGNDGRKIAFLIVLLSIVFSPPTSAETLKIGKPAPTLPTGNFRQQTISAGTSYKF